jgi:hypothetical protein
MSCAPEHCASGSVGIFCVQIFIRGLYTTHDDTNELHSQRLRIDVSNKKSHVYAAVDILSPVLPECECR